jgi:hypothetical protein
MSAEKTGKGTDAMSAREPQMITYTVNLHHRGGFIRAFRVTAPNKAAAKAKFLAETTYPAKVIAKVVVLR